MATSYPEHDMTHEQMLALADRVRVEFPNTPVRLWENHHAPEYGVIVSDKSQGTYSVLWRPGELDGRLADLREIEERAVARQTLPLGDRPAWEILEIMGPVATEADYLAACERYGVQSQSDEEIRQGTYAYRYGDPDFMSGQTLIEFLINRARFNQLPPEIRPTTSAPEIIACPNCGRDTHRTNLMNASLGTACPECYDELSDRY